MFKLRCLNLSTVDVWSQIIFCRGHPLSMEVFEARIRTLLICIISLFCGCSDCRILPSRRDVEQHPCPSFATSSSIPPTKDVSGHCAGTPRVGTTLCDNPCDGRGCWSIPCARPQYIYFLFVCFVFNEEGMATHSSVLAWKISRTE